MTKEKGRQWDGISRPTNDKYKKEFDRIFKKNNKRTYEKKIDHSNDITFENEIKKEKTLHEELMEGFRKEQEE
tara:strand:+ start:1778 stop:1996 length:219 start_codon:yes stop_codon:yes gene_type:complete